MTEPADPDSSEQIARDPIAPDPHAPEMDLAAVSSPISPRHSSRRVLWLSVLALLVIGGAAATAIVLLHARHDEAASVTDQQQAAAPIPAAPMPANPIPAEPAAPMPAAPTPAAPIVADQTPAQSVLDQRLGALETRMQGLETKPEPYAADLQALALRVKTLEATQAQQASVAAQLQAIQQTLAQVQIQAKAQAARDRALQTMEALRATYPDAAHAALKAAAQPDSTQSFWQRVRHRVEALVVIRRGNQVLLGNDAAGPLQAAQADLDRRDLAGALAELAHLQGAAAIAIQPWAAQARAALADARAGS